MVKKLIRITTVPGSLRGLLQGQLKKMSEYYEVIGISSQQGDVLENVAATEGIRVIPVEMTRTISPIQDLKATWQLYRIFRKEKPFIVHTHTPKAGTVGMLAAFLARVPHRLHTIAGLPLMEAEGVKRTLLNTVEKATYACATKIYPNSYGLKQIVLDHKFTSENKIKVIGNGSSNGIDTEYFDPGLYPTSEKEALRLSLEIHKNDVVYVYVGRLVRDKGINELIAAFVKLAEAHSNVKLLLVGADERELDPILPETEEAIDKHPQIIAMGFQTDVRPYFAISNVLTFPSYREGFPNVVLQAGAMGVPSIVTDINGCNEIIEDGINGYIIPVKDIEGLHASMEQFYNSYRSDIVLDPKVIRDHIVEKYERKTMWKAILEEYASLK